MTEPFRSPLEHYRPTIITSPATKRSTARYDADQEMPLVIQVSFPNETPDEDDLRVRVLLPEL